MENKTATEFVKDLIENHIPKYKAKQLNFVKQHTTIKRKWYGLWVEIPILERSEFKLVGKNFQQEISVKGYEVLRFYKWTKEYDQFVKAYRKDKIWV